MTDLPMENNGSWSHLPAFSLCPWAKWLNHFSSYQTNTGWSLRSQKNQKTTYLCHSIDLDHSVDLKTWCLPGCQTWHKNSPSGRNIKALNPFFHKLRILMHFEWRGYTHSQAAPRCLRNQNLTGRQCFCLGDAIYWHNLAFPAPACRQLEMWENKWLQMVIVFSTQV